MSQRQAVPGAEPASGTPLEPDRPAPLLSCFGKLARAREHFHELVAAITEFREHDHYDLDRFDNAHDESNPLLSVQWRVRILEPIPSTWAYIVGDAVNNMRSALDHALAEVVRHDLGLTDTAIERGKLQFPICDAPADFASAIGRMKAKFTRELRLEFPPSVIDTLDSLQPYKDGAGDPALDLRGLRDLSNLDKHRQLTVVSQGIYHASVSTEPPMEVVSEQHLTGPLTDGAVFATVKYRRPAGSGDINLMPELRYVESLFYPWSKEYLPVGLVLEVLHDNAVYAVDALVRDLMGPADFYYMKMFLESQDERLEKAESLIATEDELRELRSAQRGTGSDDDAADHSSAAPPTS